MARWPLSAQITNLCTIVLLGSTWAGIALHNLQEAPAACEQLAPLTQRRSDLVTQAGIYAADVAAGEPGALGNMQGQLKMLRNLNTVYHIANTKCQKEQS